MSNIENILLNAKPGQSLTLEQEIEVMRTWRDRAQKRVIELYNDSINQLVKAAHQNAINKGWYEEPRTFGEMISLMHSELSEALEDHRNGYGFKEFYFEGDKPCGIPTELADVVIRIFDACGYLGIDLEDAIRTKMAYNATRPIRHGGKKL
jgi:NTP pyrophosphatase (non-canonical NTP hydrolase)